MLIEAYITIVTSSVRTVNTLTRFPLRELIITSFYSGELKRGVEFHYSTSNVTPWPVAVEEEHREVLLGSVDSLFAYSTAILKFR